MAITASALKFETYEIRYIGFEVNPARKTGKKHRMAVAFQGSVDYQDETGKAFVSLAVEISPDFKDSGAPFRLQLEVAGTFGFREPTRSDDARNLLSRNAIAILFPYVRAAITTITSTAGVTPVILPPLNIVRLLEEQKKGNGPVVEEYEIPS